MPILQVFCPPGDAVAERVRRACVAVAEALDLPADAVIGTHVPTGATVRPGRPDSEQVVVVAHSSPRDPALVAAATEALQSEADSWATSEPAWVVWQTREPS